MELKNVKNGLLMSIINTCIHRNNQKYRNPNKDYGSNNTLCKLSNYIINELPQDHKLFMTLQNHDESELEDFNYHLSRFGFNGDQDPETFVAWVVNGMKIVYSGSE